MHVENREMTSSGGFRFRDRRLHSVAEAVDAGERLDRAMGELLAQTDDLLGVGMLANVVRERLHGDSTYYNINRHLNPTNVCVASCALCAFYVPWRRRDDGFRPWRRVGWTNCRARTRNRLDQPAPPEGGGFTPLRIAWPAFR